jgi:hypothetical protein
LELNKYSASHKPGWITTGNTLDAGKSAAERVQLTCRSGASKAFSAKPFIRLFWNGAYEFSRLKSYVLRVFNPEGGLFCLQSHIPANERYRALKFYAA